MKKLIGLLMILFVAQSCEKLDEVPYSSLSVDNLYQNEDDVDAALFGAYSALNNGNNDLWYFLYTSGPGESVVVRLKGDGNQGRASALGFLPGDAMGVWWPNFYRAINRANAVMANIPKAGLDKEVEDQKIAEARFIRGFCYFNLVKWFGGVPLQLTETTNFSDEAVKKPRASIEDVYDVIIKDFKYAETRLPKTWGKTNLGRATSGAANAFLGKVYLNMAGMPLQQSDKYQLAVDQFKKVVSSGTYALQDNFADVFSLDHEDNNEIIFERPDIREQGAGTVLTFFAGVPNSPFANRNGQYQFGFTKDFYNSFTANDKRRDVTLLYTYTDADGRSVTYNDPDNPELPYGGYNDPKGIGFGKLKDSKNEVSAFAHANDIIYMRYAGVLLMYAESLNAINKPQEALKYLNMVRKRAGVGDITVTNKDALLEKIKQERKWELAGEYQEYPDLQRWGDIKKSLPNNEDAVLFGTVYSPKIELLPIPQNQIDANPNLEQNPGY